MKLTKKDEKKSHQMHIENYEEMKWISIELIE